MSVQHSHHQLQVATEHLQYGQFELRSAASVNYTLGFEDLAQKKKNIKNSPINVLTTH